MVTRVYIVEDQLVYRETLMAFIGQARGLELCGAAASGEQALAQIEDREPSVVLMDLSLPGMSGIELLGHVSQRWGIPCIIVSGHGEPDRVRRALDSGARGYVLKGRPTELTRAIDTVVRGRRYVSDNLGGLAAFADDDQ